MNSKLTNWFLVALHVTVATVILAAVWSHYSDRQIEFERIQSNAEAAKTKADARSNEVDIKKELLKGIQEDDPYVIEKIAREEYDYTGHNELSPASP